MSEWIPIADFEGQYWINSKLQIRNSKGKLLHPIKTDAGMMYDLRRWGQRERVYAKDMYIISLAVMEKQNENKSSSKGGDICLK